MAESFAPYNFIPFSEKKVPIPYKSMETLPAFNCIGGAYSGRIDFEIHNLTGLSVGGCYRKEENQGTFCTDGRGEYIIPGSTMRGFTRSHVEILSVSFPEMVEKNRYMFRKIKDNCGKLKKEYLNKLKSSNQNGYRIPDGVKAGLLYKEKRNGEDIYTIVQVKPFGAYGTTFFQVHETDLRDAGVFKKQEYYMYIEKIEKYHGDGSIASYKDYSDKIFPKRNISYHAYRGVPVTFDYKGKICNIGKGNLKGTLINSDFVKGKTHHYIVSDVKEDISFIVDKEDILNYKRDYERNCIQNKKLIENKDFYSLPDEEGIESGKLFFYKKENGPEGKLVGFGPTPYFRVFYDYQVEDGIPFEQEKEGYDYTQALFGFAEEKNSYKSRLSFSNCRIKDKTVKTELVKLYAGSPKGTAFQMYLEQTGKDFRNLNTYNDKNLRLRGYKFYWKRSDSVKQNIESKNTNTSIAVLPKNQVFEGSIYYENLSEEELGLLLCALQVNDSPEKADIETYQIGNGKPYGYGKIAIKNIRLMQIDPKQRFTCLNVEETDITERIASIKASYKKKLKECYGIDFESDNSISTYIDFVNMDNADDYLGTHEYTYMTLKEYTNRCPLPLAKAVIGKTKEKADQNDKKRSGCLWLGKYRLDKNQEALLKNKLPQGTEIKSVSEWPDEQNLVKYAAQFLYLAIPGTTKYYFKKIAMQKYKKVYISIKGKNVDEKDSGWESI